MRYKRISVTINASYQCAIIMSESGIAINAKSSITSSQRIPAALLHVIKTLTRGVLRVCVRKLYRVRGGERDGGVYISSNIKASAHRPVDHYCKISSRETFAFMTIK